MAANIEETPIITQVTKILTNKNKLLYFCGMLVTKYE